MKKIMILGANGAIGRYMVDYFFARKDEFDIYLVTVDLESCDFIKNRSEFFRADISKKQDVDKLPKDIYAVIDLATTMPARMVGYDPKTYIDVNIGGTYNVLEFCKNNGVNRLLFAQTFGDILEHAKKDIYLKVDMSQINDYWDNKSVYIATMNTAVELIKCYHAIFKMRTFIFRLPTIYSWNSKPYCENGVETQRGWRKIIDQAIKGEDIYVWGDPNRKKDMVYVKDLCQEFYKGTFVNRDYGFYNVGTGIGTTLLDQIKGMVEIFCEKKKSRILFAPDKPNAPEYIMCIDEARKELGYEPAYNYKQMLEDMKKEKNLNRF